MNKSLPKRVLVSRAILFVLGLLVLLIFVLHLLAQPAPDHAIWQRFDDYPLVIGHADDTGQGLWPGNTLPFLEGSAEVGVDMLEMDIHMTRDGQIVLLHDDQVDRTTDGEGLVWELSLAELEQLEVGVNWTPDGGASYPYRGQGVRVPTLEAVLERFPDYPMVIEIKQREPSLAEPFCRLLREHEMTEAVIVASFSDEAINEFRSYCPEVATSAAGGEVRLFVILNYVFLSGIISPGYQAFQVPEESGGIEVINNRFVRAAHAKETQVQVWTVNDLADMQRLIDLGVDGIMTDRPDLLLELLGR